MSEPSTWTRTHWICAGLLGVGLALALMGPNLLQLGDGLPGYFNDDWANGIYLHHQVHDALTSGRFDLSDPAQFYPFGYNPIHTNGGNVLEMLVSGVARLVLPWPTWLGVAALLWIPLNLLAFVPLARRLWQSPHAIMAASAVWAIFPPCIDQMSAGRLTQVALVGLPLAVAGLLELAEIGSRTAIRLAVLGLVLSGVGYWFNALFVAMLVPLFLWHGARHRPWKSIATDLVVVGALALVLVAPLLIIVFWPRLSGEWMPGTHIDPTEMNIVFGDALKLVGGQAAGMVNWLPYVMMIGIGLTLWRGRRRALWGGLALFCVVCSLGPGQAIGDATYRMPYWWLWKAVPGLARMFHPERWMLLGGVFLTILATDGLARTRPRWTWVLPIAVFAQLWIRDVVPMKTWSPIVPDHWQALSEEADQGAIIVFPLHRSQMAGSHQWAHGRALYGGMVEDQPWAQPQAWREYAQNNELLKSLRALSYGKAGELAFGPTDIARLRKDGFTRVVYDRFSWSRMPRPVSYDPEPYLRRAFGAPLHHSQAGTVWALESP